MSVTAKQGPVLFSHGFRIFFLLALVFAVSVIPLWMLAFFGMVDLHWPFAPTDWHIHEMIFGYAGAVVAGFIFTAIPNWTARAPVQGWPLILLAGLWLAGRGVMLGLGGSNAVAVMAVECSFLIAVVGVAAAEIIAGQNWRNLVVLVPLALLCVANLIFHIEVRQYGEADHARRLGMAVVLFLIMLIGGRIIPAFTRNWLENSGSSVRPVQFNRYDGLCLLIGAVALLFWVFWPEALLARAALSIAAGLHVVRLTRWAGLHVTASPLLFVLHVAYAAIPLGLLALGLGLASAGAHILGIGAIGGMTVAVMIRAAAGHTGRRLIMTPAALLGFCLLLCATLARVLAPVGEVHFWMLILSAVLWVLGYSLTLWTIGPWLCTEKKDEA